MRDMSPFFNPSALAVYFHNPITLDGGRSRRGRREPCCGFVDSFILMWCHFGVVSIAGRNGKKLI
jgi:hypothetical protein